MFLGTGASGRSITGVQQGTLRPLQPYIRWCTFLYIAWSASEITRTTCSIQAEQNIPLCIDKYLFSWSYPRYRWRHQVLISGRSSKEWRRQPAVNWGPKRSRWFKFTYQRLVMMVKKERLSFFSSLKRNRPVLGGGHYVPCTGAACVERGQKCKLQVGAYSPNHVAELHRPENNRACFRFKWRHTTEFDDGWSIIMK